MKRILLIIALAVLLSPALVLAQAAVPITGCTLVTSLTQIDLACTDGAFVDEAVTSAWGACCAVNAIARIVDVVFVILLIVAVLLFLFGAFTLITAGGSPEKVGQGRNYILFAIIGLAVAFLSRAVIPIAQTLLGA